MSCSCSEVCRRQVLLYSAAHSTQAAAQQHRSPGDVYPHHIANIAGVLLIMCLHNAAWWACSGSWIWLLLQALALLHCCGYLYAACSTKNRNKARAGGRTMYFLVHLRRSLYLWKNFHRETATSTDFCILVETTCTMTYELLRQ